MKQTILVVGVTDIPGESVARQLHKDGYVVRILTRDPEESRIKLGDAFQFVKGDVDDILSLEKALYGCFGVYINLRGGPKAEDFDKIEHKGTANIAKVSAMMNVQRLIYLSDAIVSEENFGFPFVKAKLQAEEAIRKSGVPYSIFCATHFMEFLPLYIRWNRGYVIGNQSYPIHWLAVNDYAKMVSRAFQLPEAANKRFFIYGPEAWTMSEAIKKYCLIVHPKVQISYIPIWLTSLIGKITFNTELQVITELMKLFEKVCEGGYPEEANELLGASTTTIEQWCKKQQKVV